MNAYLAKLSSPIRVVFLLLWAAVVVTAVAFYLSRPTDFTATNIALFVERFESQVLLVYLAMSALRGFTLLPSTPLVLAGTILFPGAPWLVLVVSIVGIVISSSLIYFCSEALGFSHYFETKKPLAVARIRRRLEHPYGLAFVAAWAFFPFVPTDAVCYVAGTAKMHFPRFITAVIAGELVLCSIYVFMASSLLSTAA
jgi:uncharacterized membrane protein YdjX (TVP38/TMEM64 family)